MTPHPSLLTLLLTACGPADDVPPADDPAAGFMVHVLDHYNGGSELHLRKSLRLSPLETKAGDAVRGAAMFRVAPAP